MCISEKLDHTEPNQEFQFTVADKWPQQILETGEPSDEFAESNISVPIKVADNFTGECSYKNLGSDVVGQTN
ncbi:hypothetical protein QE152_g9305 [Popillia japonica]|uniref:Uncharacterized protein n=1 Tax=Popillia japonica TaxID=7064 RepID=A0AAW1LYT8_POPJA